MPEQRRPNSLELQRFLRRADSQRKSLERRRLTLALLFSLLIHTLLLSLTSGGQGHWLPGFSFPWQDRRIEVPDLRVVVVPAQVTAAEPPVTPVAEPLQQAWVEPTAAHAPALTPSVSGAPTPKRTVAAIVPPANPAAEANPMTDAAASAAAEQTPLRADQPSNTAPAPIPAPDVIAVERTDEATWVVPTTPAMPTPAIAEAPSAASAETAMPSLRDAGDAARAENLRLEAERKEAERLEAARQATDLQEAARVDAAKIEAAKAEVAKIEAAKVDAARIEAAKVEAAKIDAAKIDAAKIDAAKIEAANVDAARIEAAKVEAAKVEAAKIEAAKIEAAKIEAAKVEAAKIETAKIEAAKIEAAKIEAAKIEAAKVEAAQAAAARREETLRAIGRQLDEEAARREAATTAARQLPSSSGARRYRLFGRTDPNAELILYAEAWSRKIELNMTFDMVRQAAKQPHTEPVVTVAIRSDGSVESVTFVKSSGVAAIDEAIRRIVDSQRPYQVFPPGLAREYDVIEIRRTWYFDAAIRLY